jgi:predicted ester cyclase
VNAWSWRPSTSLHRLLQRDRVDEPDEFVDQNVEVNGAVHWLRNYGAGLRTVVEAFPNFPWDLQHRLINECWLLGKRSGCA